VTTISDLIQRHEGCRLTRYQDNRGFWTIGWGHCIDQRAGCQDLDPALYETDGSISQVTADALLQVDIANAMTPLVINCSPWFQSLDPVRQAVLVDMSFEMGWPTFSKFVTFLGMVSAGNYLAAADDMLRTAWAGEVPERAAEDAGMIRSGLWPLALQSAVAPVSGIR
jgi:lysozyme